VSSRADWPDSPKIWQAQDMNKLTLILGLSVAAYAAAEAYHLMHWPLFACGTTGNCRADASVPETPAWFHTTEPEPLIPDWRGRANPGWQVSGTATQTSD
jgi:hypothetical protein